MDAHNGLTLTEEVLHTGLTPVEETFHTGLTPIEEVFHTGLTPVGEIFHTGLAPVDEQFLIDLTPLQHTSANDTDFQDPAVKAYQRIIDASTRLQAVTNTIPAQKLPAVESRLTIFPDLAIDQTAPTQSLKNIATNSLIADPSFFNETPTYGNIVGPSQGLNSKNYLPSRPLDLLTAAGPVPGEPYSLQELDAMFDGFETAFPTMDSSFFTDPSFQSLQQPFFAADPALDLTLPVGQDLADFPAYDAALYSTNCDLTGYNNPAFGLAFPQVENILPAVRKDSSSSNNSSTSPPPGVDKKPPPTEQVKYENERPEKAAGKPWVRVNATTQGKTSRTGKINHYNPEDFYSQVPHPTGSWTSADSGKTFNYNQWHELRDNEFTAAELRDFIYKHPKTKDCKLTLYIQRAPADSKRRYPTSTLDRCRLRDCPMRAYGNKGSSMHGHYRVALDELSYRYGSKGQQHNDPFHVAAYVHLYCLERFLDLPEICRLPHVIVEADARQIAKEPNGSFAPQLAGAESGIAIHFIEAARKAHIQTHAQWATYPLQPAYRNTSQASRHAGFNLHRQTLNYALQVSRNSARGGRVMDRKKPSNVAVHRGDLEMYCLGRKGWLTDDEIQQIEDELKKVDAALMQTGRSKKRRRSDGDAVMASGKKVRR